jgi:hypothetical protein
VFLIRAACLVDCCEQPQAGPILIATISLPGDWRGKHYSDSDFQTERFFLKSSIAHDLFAGNGFALALLAAGTGWRRAIRGDCQTNGSVFFTWDCMH